MKKEELFNIIGEVDEQKVTAAGMAMNTKKKSRPVWMKWGAMVACLCLVVVGALVVPTLIEEAGGQGRPPLQEVRRKPEERAGRLSLQHKNAAIQHGWLRFDLGCYSPFSLSKKLLRLGWPSSPTEDSS